LDGIITPGGPAFGKYGRGWIANAPLSLHLKQRVYDILPSLLPDPTSPEAVFAGEPPRLGGKVPGTGLRWTFEDTEEDAGADFSRFHFVPAHMDALAYTALRAPAACRLQAEVLTVGPVTVCLNGETVLVKKRPFGYVEPSAVPLHLDLRAGDNRLFLYGEMICWREARIVLGLRVLGLPDSIRAGVPLGEVPLDLWRRAEESLSRAEIRRFCYPEGVVDVHLRGTEDPVSETSIPKLSIEAVLFLPLPEEADALIKAPDRASSSAGPSIPLPRYRRTLTLAADKPAVLRPDSAFFSVLRTFPRHIPLELTLRLPECPAYTVSRSVFLPRGSCSTRPCGDWEVRKKEALEEISPIRFDIMAALAAVSLGKTRGIEREALELSLDFLRRRKDCADFHALALITALCRFAERGLLPSGEAESIAEALLGFKYRHDEPGVDAMCWFTENHQIIFHAAAHLAGALFPDRRFSSSGLPGKKLAERARRRALGWILPRLAGGYSEWDSNTYLAMDMYALIALEEFSPSPALRQAAETLLHKTFFMTACQSLRGAHGCSHGRCYTAGLKTARVESTSGLQRIAWGTGGFDGETWAAGMLALSEKYRLPRVIEDIGADNPPLLVTRACSFGTYSLRNDLRTGTWEVNTLTRKTPDYLLSAALDHRPGDGGIQEHLWQLSFSPEAVLFTTWPGNGREHGNARPNFWAGSSRLPRVVMEDRGLICLYHPSFRGGLGYSHAYCPEEAFDEMLVSGPWVFVRSGNGYGALRGDGNLTVTDRGRHARQELRSKGPGIAWIAAAGREAEDGSFAGFRKKLLSREPRFHDGAVFWMTPEGNAVEFSWDGPCRTNGTIRNLRFSSHYDNDYTHAARGAESMTIRRQGRGLTLDLLRGRRMDGELKKAEEL
jgi:hypothetical protein